MGTPINPNNSNDDINASLGNVTPPLNTSINITGLNDNMTEAVTSPILDNNNIAVSTPVVPPVINNNQAGVTDLNIAQNAVSIPSQPAVANDLGMSPVQASVGSNQLTTDNQQSTIQGQVSNSNQIQVPSIQNTALEIGSQSIGNTTNNQGAQTSTPSVATDGTYESTPVQNIGANNIPIETLPTQTVTPVSQPAQNYPQMDAQQQQIQQPIVVDPQINISSPQSANNQINSQSNVQNNLGSNGGTINVSPISITPPVPVSQTNSSVSGQNMGETIASPQVQQNTSIQQSIQMQDAQNANNSEEIINYNNVDTGLNAIVHNKQEERVGQEKNHISNGVTLSELVQQSKMQAGVSDDMGASNESIQSQPQAQIAANNQLNNLVDERQDPVIVNNTAQSIATPQAQTISSSPLNATENELIASMKEDDIVTTPNNINSSGVPAISIDPITPVANTNVMPINNNISVQAPPLVNNQFAQNTLPPLNMGVQPESTKKQGKSTIVMVFFIIVFLAFGVVLLLAGLELSNSFNLPNIPFFSEFIRGIINK